MGFSKKLLSWYGENKRDLPFRGTKDPYKIWLSEIILQQTRVSQGLSYYKSFLDNFPTVNDLADASEEKVLKLWQGLGYYSRARNLHATAKQITYELDGVFPNNSKEIQKLKGVGPYTSAAIASFAFGEPITVVDGNVFRFFSRYYGIFDDISKAKTRKIFQELGDSLIDENHPDLFNQALMDFGAMICTPKKVNCVDCLYSEDCYAYRNNKITELPVKKAKVKVKNRYFHYLISKRNDTIYIIKRTEKDIWNGLYEFPKIESDQPLELNEVVERINNEFSINKEELTLITKPVKHKLSHQLLHIYFWEASVAFDDEKYQAVSINSVKDYAFPIVLWNEIINDL